MSIPTSTQIEEAIASIRGLINTPILAGVNEPADLADVYFDPTRFDLLSGGEQVLLGVIVAIWNGGGAVTVGDLLYRTDPIRFGVVINALTLLRGIA